MPIPNSEIKIAKRIFLIINDEVLIAVVDVSTGFSFIKRSTARDLKLEYNFSIILIPVAFQNSEDLINFEIRDKLPVEITIEIYALDISKIDN